MVSVGNEFKVVRPWANYQPGVYIRVEEIYTVDGVDFAVLVSDGVGPEVDIECSEVNSAIGSELQEKSRDPVMHD